jgi:ABC-2 type transport system permease protein
MLTIFSKEINTFFSSLIGYIAIGVFLLVTGLMMFVFPDTSLLDYNYATLDQLFSLAPMIFMFLIPAVTMRSFAEEIQTGTIELLTTRPLRDIEIVMGKYFANLILVLFALIPTLLYYYTVYQLGSPAGNLDSGSYIGLFLLAGVYTAIGVFASSLIDNQIVSFILATFLCFFMYSGFLFISKMPFFFGTSDTIVQMFGIDYHYSSISRGVIDTRDIVYFISIIALFIAMTLVSLEKRKW